MSVCPTSARFERTTLSRLRALGRRLRVYLLLDGLALVGVVLLAAMLATLLLDHTFRLAWDMRLVQLIVWLLMIAMVAWRWMLRPLLVPIHLEHLAVLVERRFPQLRSRLVTAVEFAWSAGQPMGLAPVRRSQAMIEAVINQADQEAAALRFEDTLNHRRARWLSSVVGACLAIPLVMTLMAPSTMGLWFERNVLLGDVEWPQRHRLTLEGDDLADGSMIVARGDDVTVSARVDHGYLPPRQVYIRYQSDDGAVGREQLPAILGEVVRFTHTFERINESLRGQIYGGDAATPWFTLKVVDRPRVNAARLGVTPPAYTKLEPYELRPGQTVAEVLAGSQVRFDITTNKPVVRAQLIRQIGGETVQVAQTQGSAATTFSAADRPRTSATYHFLLTDEVGLTNLSERTPPVRFTVRLVADRAPTVKLKVKGAGEMITPQAVLPIETYLIDEFGLAWADLVHTSSKADAQPIREALPGFEPGTRTYARTLDWPVETHGLSEGQRLSLHAEGADFDDVAGPNVGKSAVVIFRVVNRDELLAELNRREQEYRQDFERLLRQQEELYADLLTQSQASGPAAQPDRRRDDLVRLARRQRDQTSRLNVLRTQFEQVLSELRINCLSDRAVEGRLGKGVIEPMHHVGRQTMPAAAERLDESAAEQTSERFRAAGAAQDDLLAEMRAVLANMQKWEGFQEAVILLRDTLKMQRDLNRETESKIESDLLGDKPTSTKAD